MSSWKNISAMDLYVISPANRTPTAISVFLLISSEKLSCLSFTTAVPKLAVL